MRKYETTQDILDYFNPAKRLEEAEAAFVKITKARGKERLRLGKSIFLMLNNGFDADLIAESLGLPKSEVMNIYNRNKN
jgi:hypothetical protein